MSLAAGTAEGRAPLTGVSGGVPLMLLLSPLSLGEKGTGGDGVIVLAGGQPKGTIARLVNLCYM